VKIIDQLANEENLSVVLLGGREDTERNEEIFAKISDAAKAVTLNTPTTLGMRRGACFMSIPDVVITGDSFGMHMAIGLQKYIIAWFGLSCQSRLLTLLEESVPI
jgi:heptosyltransferase-2